MHNTESIFLNRKKMDEIGKMIYQIIGIDEHKNTWISGTGIFIGANLVITAKHVIEDFHERFTSKKLIKNSSGNYRLFCVQYENKNKLPALWEIVSVTLSVTSDIAVLEITPGNETAKNLTSSDKFKPIINAKPPRVGEKVCAIGFRKSEVMKTAKENNGMFIEARAIPSVSIGEVQEVYELKRDSVSINFPCFQVGFRLDGGMSGGPVLNENGELCGLVCSSIEASNENDVHTSYITSIWKLLELEIHPIMKEFYTVDKLHFLSYVEEKFIDVINLDYLDEMQKKLMK